MYSMASVHQVNDAARPALARASAERQRNVHVALLRGGDEHDISLRSGNSAAFSPRDINPAGSKWEPYREALAAEGLPTLLVASVHELVSELVHGQTWVVAFDPEDVSVAQLDQLSELGRAREARIAFVALCSQHTSPATLCRVFQSGAYLSEKSVAPAALVRLCHVAAQGMRAPLMRFSERAGLSSAEQRAFFAECAGLSKCEAANELGCSPRTLETYWSRIFTKLRIRSTDGVIAAALRFAMIETTA